MLSLAGLAGCSAAASSPPASSPAEAQQQHATIADAEADLTRAEAQLPPSPLGGLAGQPATGAPQEQTRVPESKPDGAAPLQKPAAKREARAEDEEKHAGKESSSVDAPATPCQTACRAFASMQRAADSVCRLAGDADERCASAKKRVENAKARVAHCGCS